MRPRILLVEDDEKLGAQIAATLRDGGFDPTWVRDGAGALEIALAPFRLVVLDLMLPGAYGLDVLKRIRCDSEVPVLILSARNETADKVRALKLGADDYLTKPFWPEELLARIQARLRRPALGDGPRVLALGDLAIDLVARRVQVGANVIDLTKVEYDLLAALARRPGAAVTRAALLEEALGDPDADERTLDTHVSRIRKKLGACGARIATVWRVGYRLEAERGAP